MDSAEKTFNGIPIEAIINPSKDNPVLVERISRRKVKAPELAIVEPDPEWPTHFQTFRLRILAAFEHHDPDTGIHHPSGPQEAVGVRVSTINHVGSTSVPGLSAKAVVDIDLVLSGNPLTDEPYYVPRLEAAGFQFLLREPAWYGHRFFCASEPMSCNLHVWGPNCAEVERHRIFRDWLREHEDERELYARAKRECAAAARENGEVMDVYTSRKNEVV
ncbi:Uu.00g017690.m01.CDS01 [Anthostomella pinea]|uniref:Uu.00g017690.m01.CDS01 n=1 Tax=Anthostomella pinea TaxID=933095 RepID=A0AAI8VZU5_9PEZI|nr:Uu.00g017690.m01.CDS01 [Anthostomella pinea]